MTSVVLLHPLGSDRSFYDPVVQELGGIPCEGWDLPGHGQAPMLPAGSGLADFADVVAASLRSSAAPPVIVGLSLGGLVALQLAIDHADLVAGIVVADAVPVYPPAMVDMWRERVTIARSEGIGRLIDPTTELWFTAELRASGDPRLEQMRSTFGATDPEGYARACEVLATADVTDSVQQITVPATFACGVDDAPPFVEGAQSMHGAVENSRLVWIDDARHASALEQPKQFADIVRDALG